MTSNTEAERLGKEVGMVFEALPYWGVNPVEVNDAIGAETQEKGCEFATLLNNLLDHVNGGLFTLHQNLSDHGAPKELIQALGGKTDEIQETRELLEKIADFYRWGRVL